MTERKERATTLRDGDSGTLSAMQRQAFAALLQGPYVSAEQTPELFRTISANRELFAQQLDNLFLSLHVDDSAGVAYAKTWDVDVEGKTTLMRRTPLTLLESAILLHLRYALVMTSPSERAVVGAEEVFEAMLPYQEVSGTEESALREKFDAAWSKLEANAIVRAASTAGRFEISPVLRLIFKGEEISALSASYERLIGEHSATLKETSEDDDE